MNSRGERNVSSGVTYRQVTSLPDLIDVIRIRVDVFIIEQECPPGWEPDELDKISLQYCAEVDGAIVATARMRAEPENELKIERMAVQKEYRRLGIGEGLTRHLIDEAAKRAPARLWLEAQTHARHFYEKSYFRVVSSEYDLWKLGIPHIVMEYSAPD